MTSARHCLWGSMTCLLLAAPVAPALAESGLRVSGDAAQERAAWPHWQARFGLATTGSAIDGSARWHLSAGQALGDYYWSGLRPAGVSRAGGFRATSGLLLGPRALALGTPALASGHGIGLTLSRTSRPSSGTGDASQSWLVTPYVGLGYSAVSVRGGWGFTADFGLAGATGGLRTHRNSSLGTSPGMDDLLRELRLTPVLQFGASYSF